MYGVKVILFSSKLEHTRAQAVSGPNLCGTETVHSSI